MDRLRHITVLTLLLLLSMAPAMACRIPGATMTAQERACCQRMGDKCGQTDMAASHSCCKGAVPGVDKQAIDARTAAVHLLAIAASPLAASDLLDSVLSAPAVSGYADSPPLGSPPSSISVLRI